MVCRAPSTNRPECFEEGNSPGFLECVNIKTDAARAQLGEKKKKTCTVAWRGASDRVRARPTRLETRPLRPDAGERTIDGSCGGQVTAPINELGGPSTTTDSWARLLNASQREKPPREQNNNNSKRDTIKHQRRCACHATLRFELERVFLRKTRRWRDASSCSAACESFLYRRDLEVKRGR